MPTTYEELLKLPNGARFVQADLHIHTVHSHDVDDNAMTPEAVVQTALDVGLSIIAITDHNSIAGVRQAVAAATELKHQLLVLPGIELSTPQGHLLVYFDPGEIEQLERYYHQLKIKSDAEDSRTTCSMVEAIEKASDLGGISVAAHIDVKKGFEEGFAGYPPWKKDIICSKGLFGLEFRDAGNAQWYSLDDQGSQESAERRRIFSERTSVAQIRANGALARFTNSDAHTLAEFSERRATTRLKLTELSFQSFRSALADPEARVKIDAPLPRSTSQIVGIEIDGGFLNNAVVRFSPNLNVFFGGRGTGKTSAIRAIAFALGRIHSESLPFDFVRLYSEDAMGARYRFDRTPGSAPQGILMLPGGKAPATVEADSFPIEYFGQGELDAVSREALRDPSTLQTFLDKHNELAALFSAEQIADREAREYGRQLSPFLVAELDRPRVERELAEITARLKASEDGKLEQVAVYQNKINAEKAMTAAIRDIAGQYRRGLYARALLHTPAELRKNAGLSDFSIKAAQDIITKAEAIIDGTSDYINGLVKSANEELRTRASTLEQLISDLGDAHASVTERIQTHIDKLREEGLATSLREFEQLSNRRTDLLARLARLDGQRAELDDLKTRFSEAMMVLGNIRRDIERKRKEQLTRINKTLSKTITQYKVAIIPSLSGMTGQYESFVDEEMHGTHFGKELTAALCRETTPLQLAGYLEARDVSAIENIIGDWVDKLFSRLGSPDKINHLKTIWKPYLPIIKVIERDAGGAEIPFGLLSDGQKHTILLTVALLSDARHPLVIDQPEDDLDNKFIFETVVDTLRRVKEQRQVILVTHNANIAVLGDSEQLLGMAQENGRGKIATRGSIDDGPTRQAVLECLEGGADALRRRTEIYGSHE